MGHPYLLIIVTMTVAGLAGGLLNYLLLEKDDSADSGNSVRRHPGLLVGPKWQSFVGGLVASFMVPVFLNMISSNLMDSIKGTSSIPADPSKLFILLGFCLVAAVSSKAFISTISDRILNEAKAARRAVEQVKTEVEPIVAKETEKEPGEFLMQSIFKVKDSTLTPEETKVLEALANGKFALRTRSGLAMDVGLDKNQVNDVLHSLEAKGLAKEIEITKEGKARIRWAISDKGRAVISKEQT